MKNIKKIKIIYFICYFNILLFVFLGFYISYEIYNCFSINYNLFISIFISLIVLVIFSLGLNIVNYKLGLKLLSKEFSKNNDFIFVKVVVNNKEKILKKFRLDYIDKISIVIENTKMFNSICFYDIKQYNENEFKHIRNTCKNYLKSKYPITNCTNVTKPHWNIKGEAIVLDSVDILKIDTYFQKK